MLDETWKFGWAVQRKPFDCLTVFTGDRSEGAPFVCDQAGVDPPLLRVADERSAQDQRSEEHAGSLSRRARQRVAKAKNAKTKCQGHCFSTFVATLVALLRRIISAMVGVCAPKK